jgi:hypothetical protein
MASGLKEGIQRIAREEANVAFRQQTSLASLAPSKCTSQIAVVRAIDSTNGKITVLLKDGSVTDVLNGGSRGVGVGAVVNVLNGQII